MFEDEDQSFMLLVLGVLAAVLMTVLWYVISDDDPAPANNAVAAVEQTEAETGDGDADQNAAGTDADSTDGDADHSDDAAMEEEVVEEEVAAEEPAPAPTAAPEPEPAPPVDFEPIELTVTAEDGKITLEGLVSSEDIRQGIEADASSIVGAENVTNLLVVDEGRALESGIVTTLLGSAATEEAAERLRSLAGIGSAFELSSTDELVVGTAAPAEEAEEVPAEPVEEPTEEEAADPEAAAVLVDQLASIFAFNPIQFDSGSAVISESSFGPLDQAAATLIENPGVSLAVEGHTDSEGDPGFNQVLSQNRADAVVNYLVSQGVSADQLTATGFGADQPIADNSTAEGRAENRRIDFVQLGG